MSERTVSVKFTLRRVRLNQGGYDARGEYFGIGAPLWEYSAEYPDTWNANHQPACTVGNPIPSERMDITPGGAHTCGECGRMARVAYNDVCERVRAGDRESAKDKVKGKYPEARFYR